VAAATFDISSTFALFDGYTSPFITDLEWNVSASSITPISVQDGDIINLSFGFSDSLAVTLSNAGHSPWYGMLFYFPSVWTGPVILNTGRLTLNGNFGSVQLDGSNGSLNSLIVQREGSLAAGESLTILSGLLTVEILEGMPAPTLLNTVVLRSYADEVSISAVPIPAALPLFASALAGAGLFSWWRRRRAATA
jgi:hypothetical protein